MAEVYAIINLEGYASQLRDAAASSLSENYTENLDDYITIQNVINMVNENCLGHDEHDRPLLNEELNNQVYENIISWINGVGLSKLAGQNLIECAWDDDQNDFVFWKKETTDEPHTGGKNTENQGQDC